MDGELAVNAVTSGSASANTVCAPAYARISAAQKATAAFPKICFTCAMPSCLGSGLRASSPRRKSDTEDCDIHDETVGEGGGVPCSHSCVHSNTSDFH